MTGRALRTIRKAASLTQKQAAGIMRIRTNTLARYESGQIRISPPMALLATIVLGPPHRHLFGLVSTEFGYKARCPCGVYLAKVADP